MSSADKILEAQFFLELLDAIEERSQPISHVGDIELQASFLFSAILNSFYSAYVIMRDEEGVDVSTLRNAYPEIYAIAAKGGERAKTVHKSHTKVGLSGFIPHSANQPIVTHLRPTPLLAEKVQDPANIVTNLGPEFYFHIQLKGKLVHASDFFYEHLAALITFRQHALRSTLP